MPLDSRSRTGTVVRALAAVGVLLSATGCATTDGVAGGIPGGARTLDEAFAAGWRPSQVECVFGGSTPTIEAHCARANVGRPRAPAILQNVNNSAVQRAGGTPLACSVHGARARPASSACADGNAWDRAAATLDPECDVSLLVIDSVTGARL